MIKNNNVNRPCLLGLGVILFASGCVVTGADNQYYATAPISASTDGPIPISRVMPMYPLRCLHSGIQGKVTLTFNLDENGDVSDVQVRQVRNWRGENQRVTQSNFCRREMGKQAVKAVRQFQYSPAFEDGVPVSLEGVPTTITFEIEN